MPRKPKKPKSVKEKWAAELRELAAQLESDAFLFYQHFGGSMFNHAKRLNERANRLDELANTICPIQPPKRRRKK